MNPEGGGHYGKDIAYHEIIGPEYHGVVVEPRRYTNDLLFAPFDTLIPSGGSMLDLGCGTGHMILRYGPRFQAILGIDHSPAMLEAAGQNVNRAEIPGVTLKCGDVLHAAEALTEHHDLITCVGCLHHLKPEDMPRLLRAAGKALAEDGVLLLAEPIEVPVDVPAAIQRWNRRAAAVALGYSRDAEEPDEAPLEREALGDALSDAGLEIAAENRTWEILPSRVPPSWMDRLVIRYLHWRHGRSGCVLALAARHAESSKRNRK